MFSSLFFILYHITCSLSNICSKSLMFPAVKALKIASLALLPCTKDAILSNVFLVFTKVFNIPIPIASFLYPAVMMMHPAHNSRKHFQIWLNQAELQLLYPHSVPVLLFHGSRTLMFFHTFTN